jgi:rod shape-determining protein MreD
MMTILRLAVLLYVLVMLQTVLTPAIAIAGVKPDLLFLLVLLVAFQEGAAGGAICGFVAGLFVDLNSASGLGINSLANSIVAFGVGAIADRLVRGSLWTRLITAFLATALRDGIVLLLLRPGSLGDMFHLFASSGLPGALYTALLAPPLMAVNAWLVGWSREVRVGSR